MKVAIVGYGKMGKTIERILKADGQEIVALIDSDTNTSIDDLDPSSVDVAIEFTNPDVAYSNVSKLLKKGIPVVSGSTGWLSKLTEASQLAKDKNTPLFYASNYSLGVNLFFKLNELLAGIMDKYPSYSAGITEIHHTQKLDAPSGTAISLAEGMLKELQTLKKWHLTEEDKSLEKDSLPIKAIREPDVPGTHTISYKSDFDSIELKHTAHSREGFAQGAVKAAEWLIGKPGRLYDMREMLWGESTS